MGLHLVSKNVNKPVVRPFCLVSKVRNVENRLAFFLKYYRDLGVSQFYFIDNMSTDRTPQILAKQSDVCLYQTDEKLNRHHHWVEEVLQRHCQGKWTLVVDSDEYFRFPIDDQYSMSSFLRYLDETGVDACDTNLVDMYAQSSILSTRIQAGQNPLDVCCFYDRSGNVRERLFGVRPSLYKTALIKYHTGLRIQPGMHGVGNCTKYGGSISAALLHFKLHSEIEGTINLAVREKNYYNGSIEYQLYAKNIQSKPAVRAYLGGISKRFRTTKDLIRTGHVVVSDRYIRTMANYEPTHPVWHYIILLIRRSVGVLRFLKLSSSRP